MAPAIHGDNGGNGGGGGNEGGMGGGSVMRNDAIPADPVERVMVLPYASMVAPFQPSPHESIMASSQVVSASSSRLPLNGAPPVRTILPPQVKDQDTSDG